MSKKIQSYTIDEDIICLLEEYAKKSMISKSRAIERILSNFLNSEIKIEQPMYVIPEKNRTEEQRLAEWEWRKRMVKEGKFPTWMGEEYPRTMRDPERERDVYLTPDGLPSDCAKTSEKTFSTQALTTGEL